MSLNGPDHRNVLANEPNEGSLGHEIDCTVFGIYLYRSLGVEAC